MIPVLWQRADGATGCQIFSLNIRLPARTSDTSIGQAFAFFAKRERVGRG
jgi:hypothetical protein